VSNIIPGIPRTAFLHISIVFSKQISKRFSNKKAHFFSALIAKNPSTFIEYSLRGFSE